MLNKEAYVYYCQFVVINIRFATTEFKALHVYQACCVIKCLFNVSISTSKQQRRIYVWYFGADVST